MLILKLVLQLMQYIKMHQFSQEAYFMAITPKTSPRSVFCSYGVFFARPLRFVPVTKTMGQAYGSTKPGSGLTNWLEATLSYGIATMS